MKKLCTILLGSLSLGLSAQTQQLFFEDFSNAFNADIVLNSTAVNSTNVGDNTWTINNSYAGGNISIFCFQSITVPVTATPAQPGGITNPNGNYLHLSSLDGFNTGVDNAHYRAADGLCTFSQNYFSHMSVDVNTTGLSGVSLNFWWLCQGSPNEAFGELYYSTNGGNTWTQFPNFTMVSQGSWTQTSISSTIFDNKAQLRFGWRFVNNQASGGSDPALAIDDIEITGPLVVPGITTGDPASATLCSGQSITVPFTLVNGPMNANNTFSLEMSDANGNFSGNVIGTLNATTGNSITGTLPNMTPGSGYLFRVNASDPQTTGTANGTASSSPAALNISFTHTIDELDVEVTNTSGSSPNATWLFCPSDYVPAGGQPYTHTFPSSGSYCVCLKADNGCVADSVCETVDLCGDVDADVNLTVDGPDVTVPDSIEGADSVVVDFGNGNVVTNPSLPYVHTYTSLGPQTVCIYAYNDCGNADTNCVDVTISSLQGMSSANQHFNIFPNPSNDQVRIEGLPIHGWELFSLTGQRIGNAQYDVPQSQSIISVENLAAGTYLLLLKGEKQQWYSRISVVH